MPDPDGDSGAPQGSGEDSAAGAILRRMKGSRVALVVLAAALFGAPPAPGATKKKKPKPTPTATPTPSPAPTPTPAGPELHKAAGSCLRYEAGAFILLSEVGQPGRAFKIDAETDIAVRVRRGARLRILYVETPDGPVARKILPGPVDETKD